MKIAMLVLNPFVHDTRVIKEAHTLTRNGHKVVIWALKIGDYPTSEEMYGFQVNRLEVKAMHLHPRPPGLVYGEIITQMTRHLYRENADVYHAHDPKALPPIYIASRLRKVPFVYDSHEFWPSFERDSWKGKAKSKIWQLLERLLGKRAAGIITVNPSIAKEMKQLYGITPIILMNCQEYRDVPKSNLLRENFNIPEKQRIAIYPGNWNENRGLEQLIASIPYLDRVTVVIMGTDKMNGKLQRLAKELGITTNIKFCSPVPPEEVPKYVASADIGVMPTQSNQLSYYYGSGNKLFHYLMAGIPAAVSNHPEKRRIVETYEAGIVFDETNPKSIAEAINTTLNDKKTYQRLCYNAKKAAQEELNWEIEEKKLLHLYNTLNNLT